MTLSLVISNVAVKHLTDMTVKQIPKQDLEALEEFRNEARRYLPRNDAHYAAEIAQGTDPYFHKFMDAATWVMAVAVVAIAASDYVWGWL